MELWYRSSNFLNALPAIICNPSFIPETLSIHYLQQPRLLWFPVIANGKPLKRLSAQWNAFSKEVHANLCCKGYCSGSVERNQNRASQGTLSFIAAANLPISQSNKSSYKSWIDVINNGGKVQPEINSMQHNLLVDEEWVKEIIQIKWAVSLLRRKGTFEPIGA